MIPAVTIAPASPGGDPSTPTGQVFNSFVSSGAFTLSDGSPATFLFATEDGTISGWNGGGNPIVIPDLWELIPGNGGSAGNTNAIYFTSGVKDEAHGLFGSLTANATPSTATMTGSDTHHQSS